MMDTYTADAPKGSELDLMVHEAHVKVRAGLQLSHIMICHSKKCHRPHASSCHKEPRGERRFAESTCSSSSTTKP